MAKTGFDVVPINGIRHPVGRRARLLRALAVTQVADVGANSGQFAVELRDAGFVGRIVSIEPLDEAFASLEVRAAGDGLWDVLQCAVGTSDGETVINIAGNSASSSLLAMLPAHEEAAPGTAYVGQQTVRVRRLESILDERVDPGETTYLKVDVQGYDLEVLRGAGRWLRMVAAVQVELSLAPLYAGAPLAADVDAYVRESGFELVGVEPGFADPRSGRLLQMDGVYVRSNLASTLLSGPQR